MSVPNQRCAGIDVSKGTLDIAISNIASQLHILAQRERSFWFYVNAYSGGKYHDLAPWPESLFILPESVFTRPELPFTPPESFLTH